MSFLLQILFIYFFWPYHSACVILVPQPGIEPVPPASLHWESGVLTTGHPGMSLSFTHLMAMCKVFNEMVVFYSFLTCQNTKLSTLLMSTA